MTNTPAWHKHTTSSSEIYGTLLEPGDVLEDLDCYDSPNGTWALYLMPGLLVGYGSVHIWVRPVAPLTNDDLIEIRDGMLAISEPSVSQPKHPARLRYRAPRRAVFPRNSDLGQPARLSHDAH